MRPLASSSRFTRFTRFAFVALLLGALVASLALAGCSKPEPPTLTAKEVRVTAIRPEGIDVVVRMEAANPNRFSLFVKSFTASALIDGRWKLAPVTVTKAVELPARATTSIDVPLSLRWDDVQVLGSLVLAHGDVRYTVDGTANIGAERFDIKVPYLVGGVITRDQIAAGALRSIPLIPGLTGPAR